MDTKKRVRKQERELARDALQNVLHIMSKLTVREMYEILGMSKMHAYRVRKRGAKWDPRLSTLERLASLVDAEVCFNTTGAKDSPHYGGDWRPPLQVHTGGRGPCVEQLAYAILTQRTLEQVSMFLSAKRAAEIKKEVKSSWDIARLPFRDVQAILESEGIFIPPTCNSKVYVDTEEQNR